MSLYDETCYTVLNMDEAQKEISVMKPYRGYGFALGDFDYIVVDNEESLLSAVAKRSGAILVGLHLGGQGIEFEARTKRELLRQVASIENALYQ